MESKVGIAPLVSLLVAVIMLCCGCAESNPARPVAANGEKFFAVANPTPFYRYGPQQGSGPDKTLPKDTLVTLIRSSFGFAKVKITNGEQGYVARDDIGPAPPALIAAAITPSGSSGVHSRAVSAEPQFIPPPEVNPEFEPTPIPSPSDSEN